MTELVVCRACLVADVALYPTVNLYTQEVFQHLTNLPFESMDGKPQCLCYECHATMRHCVQFRDKCLRADGVLNQLLSSEMLTTESLSTINRHVYKLTSNLICTQMETISVPCYNSTVKTEYEVSIDPAPALLRDANEEDRTWPQPKQEKLELAIEDAVLENKIENVKIESHFEDSLDEDQDLGVDSEMKSDSEDDLPLTSISRGQKQIGQVRNGGEKKRKGTRVFAASYAREVSLTPEEQLAEMRARATSANYLHSQYKCELCFKGFVDDTAFRNHQDKHSESRGAFSCGVCALRYATARQLRAHEVSAHARQYHCVACAHRSHTAHQAREHERWHRGLTYSCGLCGAQFRKPTSHLTHMRKKHATEHVCRRCGDSFVGRRGLDVHNTKSHREPAVEEDTPESQRTCVQCDITFLTVEACRRHTVNSVKHKHDTENSNACSKCAQRFASADALLAHQRVHAAQRRALSGVRIACTSCSGHFGSKSKLQAHVRRVHLGLKYSRNVVCELCGKRCTSNATLRYHQRTHTGERPYACAAPSCARRFADSHQLRIHARTHSGERPYSCHLCSKAFRQKPSLNRHMRVHTGAKPYACQYCAKTFSQSNSQKLHVRTVHLKIPPNNRRNKAQIATAEKEQSTQPQDHVIT